MCAVNPFVVGFDDNMVHPLFIVSKVSSRWRQNMLDNMLNNYCIVVSTLGALQRIFFSKNPRLLWKWVSGSKSHSEFFWKSVPK